MNIFRIFSAIIITFFIAGCDGGTGGSDAPVAPDTPENITVTPVKGGMATVAWTGDAGNGTYSLVYNTQNSITEGSPEIETCAATGIEISGLTIGGSYYFWIVPVDEDDVEMTPVAAPDNDSGGYMMPEYDDPDTPSDIYVHIYSDGDVFVKWSGNTNDGSYKVYANINHDLTGTPVSGSDSGYDESDNRYYESICGLTSGNSYYICVVPVKQDGTELTPVWYDSDTETAGVVDPIYIDLPAEVPSNISAVIDADGNVRVSWDGNSNDGIYRIYCGSTPEFHSCSEMYQADVSSPYTISDLATGTWYIFVSPGTDDSFREGVIANSGSPVQIWVPHMINEIIGGTGVRSLQCDGDYIYYTDYSNNFGMIDIRGVTDFSEASFSPTPVTQNVSSMNISGFALVGDQAFFSLYTGTNKDDPEMARISITKGTGAPTFAAPSTLDLDTYKTGSAIGHYGKNITTDGTYVYLFAEDKSYPYPDEELIASFNPATSTWLDYVSAGSLCNNPGMTITNNTIYASLNKSISTFDITDPNSLGIRVSNTVNDSLGGQIILSGNYIFTYASDTVEIFNKDDYSLASSVTYSSSIYGMYVSGNFLFVTNSYQETEGMGIIDITDPANPGPVRWVITGTYTYNNYNKMAAGIAVVGNYAFVGTPNGISVVELSE